VLGDPSLRLKSAFAQDDALPKVRVFAEIDLIEKNQIESPKSMIAGGLRCQIPRLAWVKS